MTDADLLIIAESIITTIPPDHARDACLAIIINLDDDDAAARFAAAMRSIDPALTDLTLDALSATRFPIRP